MIRLDRGAVLWRVHHASRAATQLKLDPPAAVGGGRFDVTDGTSGYLYLNDAPGGAIAETLCRDLPFVPIAARIVRRRRLANLMLTAVTVVEPITLVNLVGADTQHVGQDVWLTSSEPSDYPATRTWAAAIRRWVPTADGLSYLARNNQQHMSYVLYEPAGGSFTRAQLSSRLASHSAGIALDSSPGTVLVKKILEKHNATLSSH